MMKPSIYMMMGNVLSGLQTSEYAVDGMLDLLRKVEAAYTAGNTTSLQQEMQVVKDLLAFVDQKH
jgi:hypothetical protein